MRIVKIEINLLEKGDRVLTPYGKGTVWEDQILGEFYPEVDILLDNGCSDYPNGHKYPITIENSTDLRIL